MRTILKRETGKALPVRKLSRCQRKKLRRRMALIGRQMVAAHNARIAWGPKLRQVRRQLLADKPACAIDGCGNVCRKGHARLTSRDGAFTLVCGRKNCAGREEAA